VHEVHENFQQFPPPYYIYILLNYNTLKIIMHFMHWTDQTDQTKGLVLYYNMKRDQLIEMSLTGRLALSPPTISGG